MPPKSKSDPLATFYNADPSIFEIGVDEVGRGPMLGRVYTAAVILPKDNSFDHSLMKDSKRFHSEKKIKEASDYIKENAIAWAITYESEEIIDKINIRQATLKSMQHSIKSVLSKHKTADILYENYQLIVDGNDFKPLMINNNDRIDTVKYVCVEGGDNKYTCIAAASILAKVARDEYIAELCKENPELIERYNILSNKGYGAKAHMEGIKTYGISKWHRKTYGICKQFI